MIKKSFIFLLITLSFLSLMADFKIIESNPQSEHDAVLKFKHHLTREEIEQAPEYPLDFPTFNPPVPNVRPVAEFEQMNGVLIRYPLGIPLEFVRELSLESRVLTVVSSQQYNNAVSAFTNANVNMENCEFMVANTDSYWTRDYGPWYSVNGQGQLNVIDFTYNRPRPNDNAFMATYATYDTLSIYHMGIVQTGGNYMTDGISIAASSHIAYTENNNNQNLVNQAMLQYLGIETYHVVQDPNGTYIDHIDCWGKFLGPDKLLLRSVPQSHSSYQQLEGLVEYFSNQLSGWGRPYRIYRVYTPNNQPYTNSLILNNRVFVPVTGSSHDAAALQVYRDAMPGYEIIGVLNNTGNPWLETDALHCRTHELADRRMLYIGHIPFALESELQDEYPVYATVQALSGAELVQDSVRVYYKINSNDYESAVMIPSEFFDDEYYFNISGLIPGDTLHYYIRAVDELNNSANHPYIGRPDAHYTVVTPDETAPVIIHEPISLINIEDFPFMFSAYVTDNYLLGNVYFEYYTDINEEISVNQMNEDVENIYTYLLDISQGVNRVFYRIRAIDASHNQNIAFLPMDSWFEVGISTSVSEVVQANTPLNVSLYPNPLSLRNGELNLKISSDRDADLGISLFNVKGQRVAKTNASVKKNSIQNHRWNLSELSLANGIYFVKIENSAKPVIQKLLIIK